MSVPVDPVDPVSARAGAGESDPARPTGIADTLQRALDLVIALPLVIVTAPLIAVLAVLIRLESRGGALFKQVRAGRAGQPFEIYKLRTMVSGAEHVGAGLAVLQGDSRITRSGELLRRYSLDELPNLWNVLRGEMSVVGPRPTLPGQVEAYTEHQRRRLEVRPGITGWAQVNGRTTLPWSERIELDIWYVEHRSLWLDVRILALTVRMVVGGHGLYHPDASGGVDLGSTGADPTGADPTSAGSAGAAPTDPTGAGPTDQGE